MTDFLLELRSEEIPARMQAGARAELDKLFRAQMATAGIELGDITVWSTPRRLALIARSLPLATAPVSEERKGPRADAPEQAIAGFKRGLPDTARIEEREDAKGGKILYAIIDKPGLPTDGVLMNAIHAILRGFSWPKSMRWGPQSKSTDALRWVRPLQGIVALFGDRPIICGYEGVESSKLTVGHRFHSSGMIQIDNVDSYAATLRKAYVIVDHAERQDIIRDGAAKAAADAGLTLVADEGLVVENAGLTEWPVPLLGRFDEAFLEVPPEVIQLTARVNQKYFVVNGADGKLANGFVCTANIDAKDGGAEIVAGNRKVLAARLSDARFFWEQDQKKTLAQHAEKLANITFHEKLGTVADKVERVAKLAEWLASEGIVPNCDPALARQAAELAKADLVTEMVGEFPELQGLMGGYYARAEGLPDAVADAIRDHYKPVGQGDDVPTAPVTVAVALADKLDTLVSFFAINEKPTGSKDPFALRRAVLGIAQIVVRNQLRLPLRRAFAIIHLGWIEGAVRRVRKDALVLIAEKQYQRSALELLRVQLIDDYLEFAPSEFVHEFTRLFELWDEKASDAVPEFAADRLKVQQREAGVRHDLIDAVFALGGEDDLVRLLARVKALQAFMATDDGANLLAGYKRAANILKQAGKDVVIPAKAGIAGGGEPTIATPAFAGATDMDRALLAALDAAEPAAAAAVADERFTDAMAALALLRAPIDAFFEGVMVNDPEEAVRAYRLGLLARFTGAVHGVADFSKIEG